jgi:predicted membrane metal-binding protein
VILVSFLDTLRQEPVRVYIYGLALAIIAALVFFGVVTGAAAPVIIAVVLAALAVPSPVEVARSKVTPVVEETTEPK